MYGPEDNNANDSPQPKMLCPYVKTPLPHCYCVDMDNRKLSLALRFCQQDFRYCPIYRRISP